MKFQALIFSTLFGATLYANESVSSEMSHVVGGMVMAGGITTVVDHYYPEYRSERGMIGFKISSAAVIVEQSIELAIHGNAEGQLLDVVAHIAGSALGAWSSDQYFLSPVIQNSASEGQYIGLNLHHAF